VENRVPYADANSRAELDKSYLATHVSILSSHRVGVAVVDALDLVNNPGYRQLYLKITGGQGAARDWIADWIIQNYLVVEPAREGRLININYLATNPKFAMAAANAFARAYMDAVLDLTVQPARFSADWFSRQLGPLRSKLELAKEKLTIYQRNNGIVIALDGRTDIESTRLQELSSKLVTAQAETTDALKREAQLKALLAKGDSLETAPEILTNPFIQTIKGQIGRQEAALAQLSQQLGENHPDYQKAQAELAKLRNQLQREIASVATGVSHNAQLARQRQQAAESALAAQKTNELNLKQQRDAASILYQEVEDAQRAYDDALQRSKKASLEGLVSQTNVALLSEAVEPAMPSSPILRRNVAIAGVLGVALGLGLAFLFEVTDHRVRCAEDVVRHMRLPLLGTIG
jgi:chain length determinant protein EpsF